MTHGVAAIAVHETLSHIPFINIDEYSYSEILLNSRPLLKKNAKSSGFLYL